MSQQTFITPGLFVASVLDTISLYPLQIPSNNTTMQLSISLIFLATIVTSTVYTVTVSATAYSIKTGNSDNDNWERQTTGNFNSLHVVHKNGLWVRSDWYYNFKAYCAALEENNVQPADEDKFAEEWEKEREIRAQKIKDTNRAKLKEANENAQQEKEKEGVEEGKAGGDGAVATGRRVHWADLPVKE
ncbi:hypothetical protein BC835DRAFT_1416203 [Cytidiella melzeri]|nr:hypothetical protein BC835DRAFT_1416203 [Cytidiella melzeri]